MKPFPCLTRDQMREVDRIATEELGLDVLQLMEYAGLNIARFAQGVLKARSARDRVVVLAGTGNNGGDGMVAARHLSNWGVPVTVIATAPTSHGEGAAGRQQRILLACQIPLVRVTTGDEVARVRSTIQESDLLIDALLGFGGSGPPRSPIAELIRLAHASQKPLLAVDLPSGLDASTGGSSDPCIRATWTLTLGLPKKGLLAPGARPFVGDLFVADIGIPPWVYQRWGVVGPVFDISPWVSVPIHVEAHEAR